MIRETPPVVSIFDATKLVPENDLEAVLMLNLIVNNKKAPSHTCTNRRNGKAVGTQNISSGVVHACVVAKLERIAHRICRCL